MNPQIKISEQLKLVAVVDPQTVNSTPAYSDAVDMSKYERIFAVASLGNMAAETIDFLLQADTVNTFDDSAATVVASTQLAAHASNNDNKQLVLELKAEDLTEGDQFVRAQLVTGDTSGGPASVAIFGIPKSSKESQLSSVAEVKSA